MLDTGDPAPDFFLPAAEDRSAEYMLSAAADAGPVVLAFISCSDPGARRLLQTLADLDWAALTDQISAFGICPDGTAAERLAADVSFPVLVDRGAYVADLYGVADPQTGRGPDRAVVLVDQQCTIRFCWRASGDDDRLPLEQFRSAVSDLPTSER
ncbi:MAG: redoxin domain-containing protein [Halapricum sp.]